MKKWKKITAGALSICMMATYAPCFAEIGGLLPTSVTAHAETSDIVITGSFSYRGNWSYNRTTKVMTITGTGKVSDNNLESSITKYRNEMKKLVFSDGITTIGYDIFENCTALEEIDFGKVKEIDYQAFSGCTSLKTLNFPDTLEELDFGAFCNCTNLSSVTIGSKLKTVYPNTFEGCDNLTSITVSKNNKYLYAKGTQLGYYKISGACGENATFSYNKKTKTLTLSGSGAMYDGRYTPNEETTCYRSLERWKDYRNFLGDSPHKDLLKQEVETIVIGDKITHIGTYAFADFKSLKKVKLGKKVTSIGNCAFSQCSKLNTISSSASLKTIGKYCFYACKNLKSFSIGKSVKTIGNGAFLNCAKLKSFSVHSSNPYFSKRGNMLLDKKQSTLVSACFASNKVCNIYGSVKSINEAILEDTSIKSFSVSKKNTKYTSKNGLLYSKNGKTLKKCPAKMSGTVTTGDTVTTIDINAFKNCNNITQMNIGKKVSSMDSALCHISCKKLDNIQISAENAYYYETNGSIVSKADETLVACYKIDGDTYTFPESVQSVDGHVFCNQGNLKKVIIPNKVDLGNCFNVAGEIGLDTIESIHLGAQYDNPQKDFETFHGLSALKEITVSSENPYFTSVDGVLYNKEMTQLLFLPRTIETYSIPNGVTSVGYVTCFGFTTTTFLYKLKNLTLPDTLTDINWLLDCDNLETVHLGKNVSTSSAIYASSSKLKSISVDEENNNLKVVNNMLYTKDGSQLLWCPAKTEGKVVLEPGVTTISGSAFYYCEKITDIVIPDTLSEVDKNAFYDLNNIIIWVPKGKKNFYTSLFTKETGFKSNMLIMELEN